MRPCLTCGEPSDSSYCDDHDRGPWHHREGSASDRGYDHSWTLLSKRARRLQPFCLRCGSVDDLQTDHLPSAWERKAAGKPIRLRDVQVLCGPCNVDAGSSRPGRDPGRQPGRRAAVTVGQAQSALHTASSVTEHVDASIVGAQGLLDALPGVRGESSALPGCGVDDEKTRVSGESVAVVAPVLAGVSVDVDECEFHSRSVS